ncbi:MAG: CsbD family protein [Cyanobacteria bacterium P01_D01_bin.50]
MKNSSSFTNSILSSKRYLASIFCSFLILTFAWLGVFTDINSTADAGNLDTQYYSQLIAFGSNDGNSIKDNFDTVLGAGTSDKIEGKAEQAVGNVKQNIGKISGQVEGLAKQAQGRAKEDIGRTKDTAEDVADKIEDTTESTADGILDFFSN